MFFLLLYKITTKIYEHILYSAVDKHESTQALYETGKKYAKTFNKSIACFKDKKDLMFILLFQIFSVYP